MAKDIISKIDQQIIRNYTPEYSWYRGGTAPTVQENLGYYLILNKNLMIVGFRVYITDVGSPSVNDFFMISVPTGVAITGDPFPTAGVIYNTDGPTNLVLRGSVSSNLLSLNYGIGGNQSGNRISNGWLGGFGFVPVKIN